MSAHAALLVRSFPVGRRTVTITIPPIKPGAVVCMSAEWAPSLPRSLSRRELQQYAEGRHAVMAELADIIGGTVMVVSA